MRGLIRKEFRRQVICGIHCAHHPDDTISHFTQWRGGSDLFGAYYKCAERWTPRQSCNKLFKGDCGPELLLLNRVYNR